MIIKNGVLEKIIRGLSELVNRAPITENKHKKVMKIEKSIKERVLEEYKNGNIVVAGVDGLQGMPLKEFIKQPTEDMLYDLNRDEATVLTFITHNNPKWVNDYAVCQVIRALKKRIEELEKQIEKLK